MATDAQTLTTAAAAAGYLKLSRRELLECFLVAVQTVAIDAQTLINSAASAGYAKLSERELEECILASLSSGGAGGAGGVSAGAYGVGNPPNFTPSTAGAIAINTSDGVEWTWFNGVWQ